MRSLIFVAVFVLSHGLHLADANCTHPDLKELREKDLPVALAHSGSSVSEIIATLSTVANIDVEFRGEKPGPAIDFEFEGSLADALEQIGCRTGTDFLVPNPDALTVFLPDPSGS